MESIKEEEKVFVRSLVRERKPNIVEIEETSIEHDLLD